VSETVIQTINAPIGGHMAGGDVRVANHTHNHQHHHNHTLHAHGQVIIHHATVLQQLPFALQAPPAPPARNGGRPDQDRPEITPSQRGVLALMRPLPKPQRIAVLNWMRSEFGTALVMDLDPRELYRLRIHLADVRRAAGVVGG